jgi:hypothetical protein
VGRVWAGTADTSGNGEYNMGKTCSVSGGVLDINVHSEMVGGVQKNYGAAPWPIIPGNQPQGTIGGLSYNNISVRANIYYGQIEYAFRASAAPRWKTAWLLWPDVGGNLFPKYGEIDFVEGNLDGSTRFTGSCTGTRRRSDPTRIPVTRVSCTRTTCGTRRRSFGSRTS